MAEKHSIEEQRYPEFKKHHQLKGSSCLCQRVEAYPMIRSQIINLFRVDEQEEFFADKFHGFKMC